jgi:hypothetical protein
MKKIVLAGFLSILPICNLVAQSDKLQGIWENESVNVSYTFKGKRECYF